MEYKDYYRILGVERTADEKAIKTAYRKLARKHHPDVAKDKSSVGRFQEITEAYEVLSDPEKRRRYDTLGSDWERQATGAGTGGRVRTPGGGSVHFETAGGDLGGFSDFFQSIFGDLGRRTGGRGSGGRVQDFRRGGFGGVDFGDLGDLGGRAATETAGSDAEAVIELTLEEAFNGVRKPLALAMDEVCSTCGGAGHLGGKPCQTCRGTGWKKTERRLEVKIPAGVDTGSRIRVAGEGAPGSDGKKGDLYLRVTVKAPPPVRAEGRRSLRGSPGGVPRRRARRGDAGPHAQGQRVDEDSARDHDRAHLPAPRLRHAASQGREGGRSVRADSGEHPLQGSTQS